MIKKSVSNGPIIKYFTHEPINVHLIKNNAFFQRLIAWENAYNNEKFLNGFFDELKKEYDLTTDVKKNLLFSILLFFQAHSDGLMEIDWDRLFKMKKDVFVKYVNAHSEIFEIHFPDRVKNFNEAIEKSKKKDGFTK